jgi:hypothetical protein
MDSSDEDSVTVTFSMVNEESEIEIESVECEEENIGAQVEAMKRSFWYNSIGSLIKNRSDRMNSLIKEFEAVKAKEEASWHDEAKEEKKRQAMFSAEEEMDSENRVVGLKVLEERLSASIRRVEKDKSVVSATESKAMSSRAIADEAKNKAVVMREAYSTKDIIETDHLSSLIHVEKSWAESWAKQTAESAWWAEKEAEWARIGLQMEKDILSRDRAKLDEAIISGVEMETVDTEDDVWDDEDEDEEIESEEQ